MFRRAVVVAVVVVLATGVAMADDFGTGVNAFTIDFVPISCATNPASGYGIVDHNYRMGVYEITNDQWNKFTAAYGTVTGSPASAYGFNSSSTGSNAPTNNMSWYAAAQFVNWLNTNTGHRAAYKFTGTQGTSDYTFTDWSPTDTGYDVDNPYRNKAAKYYLPTEDEWVKAAYWNGFTMQTYATKAGDMLFQGSGTNGGWNYYLNGDYGPAGDGAGPWNVGSGNQELNGTYDMMGNVWEWIESPYSDPNYGPNTQRAMRGSSFGSYGYKAASSERIPMGPTASEFGDIGFRVASVPEPGSLAILAGVALTALAYWWRKGA
jgi:formylglycine-generating enzyme required for sulfatase activity